MTKGRKVINYFIGFFFNTVKFLNFTVFIFAYFADAENCENTTTVFSYGFNRNYFLIKIVNIRLQ